PELQVTLLEAHQRKAVFLKEVSRGRGNVRVLAKRIGEVREEFDCAVSRAVSYRDLGQDLGRLARRAGVLTGIEEPPEEWGMRWESPVALPWGRQRFVRVGVVSRETTSRA